MSPDYVGGFVYSSSSQYILKAMSNGHVLYVYQAHDLYCCQLVGYMFHNGSSQHENIMNLTIANYKGTYIVQFKN
jgi:hypothetical protein